MTETSPDGLSWEACLEESLSLVDALLAGPIGDPAPVDRLAGLLDRLHSLRGPQPDDARDAQLRILLRCAREVEAQARNELAGMAEQLNQDGRRRRLLNSMTPRPPH